MVEQKYSILIELEVEVRPVMESLCSMSVETDHSNDHILCASVSAQSESGPAQCILHIIIYFTTIIKYRIFT